MKARIIELHYKTVQKLLRILKEAEIDGEYRVAKRIRAIIFSSEGKTSGEIAEILKVRRSCVRDWLKNYEKNNLNGILEGHRTGRPPHLTSEQLCNLNDIVASGPISYGFSSGVWDSLMIREIIKNEFKVTYDPRHVRRLLHYLRFSVQVPIRYLARGNLEQKEKWKKHVYPSIKSIAKRTKSALIFEDEVSFRQDSTLHRTWAKCGHQPSFPVTGERKCIKYFGCINIFSLRFLYHKADSFNTENYLVFLEQIIRQYKNHHIYYIHDNASYHTDKIVYKWIKDSKDYITVYNLPAYSPELNAQERLWRFTRKAGTHNIYFRNENEINIAVIKVFKTMQHSPKIFAGYLHEFS